MSRALSTVVISLAVAITAAAHAQPAPDGFDWVTIAAPSNEPYNRIDQSSGRRVTGRGSVPYYYRIGRTEVSTAQWLEFYNSASMREGTIPFVELPVFWGAVQDHDYTGPGTKYRLSNESSGQWPCVGMTWRTAAVYCNWLNNGRSSEPSAFASGAYDVSTFAIDADGVYTDQAAHTPGATYWIPTLDERMKATHYDPNKDGVGGWWLYPNGSDSPLTYGVPGIGQANAGFRLPNDGESEIPLGAYPDVVTPWGLLDAAGAGSEFLETELYIPLQLYRGRMTSGSSFSGLTAIDRADGVGAILPDQLSTRFGLRLASIPSLHSLMPFIACGTCCILRRRRLP